MNNSNLKTLSPEQKVARGIQDALRVERLDAAGKPMTKRVLKNPVDVQMHWTRRLLPEPAQERVDALSNEIARGTKLPPGYLIEPNLLVAGETRRRAHKARQVDMEFIVITEEEALGIALGENTNRLSYKYKYQIAFAYCPLACKAVEVSQKEKLANLRQGAAIVEKSAETPTNPRKSNFGLSGLFSSLDEVADAIQVSRSQLADAKKTFDELVAWDKENEPKKWGEAKTKMTALAYWTERIMDQEDSCTPGQARAGLAGSTAAEDGKTNPKPKQLELFVEGLKSLAKWGKSFDDLDDAGHRVAVSQIKKTIAQLPPKLRAEIAAEIKLQDAK